MKERSVGRQVEKSEEFHFFIHLLLASWWGANALGACVEVRKYFCLVKITQMKQMVFTGGIHETVNILEQLITTRIKEVNL